MDYKLIGTSFVFRTNRLGMNPSDSFPFFIAVCCVSITFHHRNTSQQCSWIFKNYIRNCCCFRWLWGSVESNKLHFMTSKKELLLLNIFLLGRIVESSPRDSLREHRDCRLQKNFSADNRLMLCMSCSLMIVIATHFVCVWMAKNESQATMKRL